MNIGKNIQTIRKELGLLQKVIALELKLDKSSYSKVESGLREVKISELKILANIFNMSIDDIVNYDDNLPVDIILEDKSENEQFKLINQLNDEDKSTILKIIDKMLTNKKFKDFFDKNVASL